MPCGDSWGVVLMFRMTNVPRRIGRRAAVGTALGWVGRWALSLALGRRFRPRFRL
jgi:hypothetical protein